MMKQDYTKQKMAIRYWLLGKGWTNAVKAMDFAENLHTGTRKDGQAEFSHQVSQANYARTLWSFMLFPEETLCVIFLHDVMEDYDISYQELEDRFGARVATAVMLMSKVIKGRKIPNEVYYPNLATCPIASAAKGFDRVHNLMTMVGGFKPEKQASYLEETSEHTIPMLKLARRSFPDQEPLYENIKFVMTNQTILYNELLSNKKHAVS
jgi:(p)ppGpp synthase/HD superfamily hydrolase